MQQLKQLEYAARRTHVAIRMNNETKKLYHNLDDLLRDEALKTKATIRDAKIVIEEETKHRKHSMEYEALFKLIESKPDRKAMDARKQLLEEQVQNLAVRNYLWSFFPCEII